MVKIGIKKVLEKKLRAGMAEESDYGSICRMLVSLIDEAEARKDVVKGVAPQEVIRVIRSVLGSSALLPPTVTPAFYSMVKNRVNFLGVTLDDVERAAYRAKQT